MRRRPGIPAAALLLGGCASPCPGPDPPGPATSHAPEPPSSAEPASPEPASPAPASPEPARPLPAPRAGADRLGERFEEAWIERWIGEPVRFGDAPATLVRFWTDTCGFCAASLPALERIRLEFAERGLATLAVYHPKPPRPVEDAAILAAARRMGYEGPLAADPAWRALRRIWLDGAERPATSASFLLDRAGRVRFVHAGPVFHPPGEDHGLGVGSEEAAADYEDLRRAVGTLLGP